MPKDNFGFKPGTGGTGSGYAMPDGSTAAGVVRVDEAGNVAPAMDAAARPGFFTLVVAGAAVAAANPLPVRAADGDLVTVGGTADAAAGTGGTGTVSAKLRRLSADLASGLGSVAALLGGPIDVTPASPAAGDYLPVRLTDGGGFLGTAAAPVATLASPATGCAGTACTATAGAWALVFAANARRTSAILLNDDAGGGARAFFAGSSGAAVAGNYADAGGGLALDGYTGAIYARTPSGTAGIQATEYTR